MFSFKFSKMGLCSVSLDYNVPSQIPHPKLDLPDTSERTVNLLHSVSIFSLTLTPLKPLSRGEGGLIFSKQSRKTNVSARINTLSLPTRTAAWSVALPFKLRRSNSSVLHVQVRLVIINMKCSDFQCLSSFSI